MPAGHRAGPWTRRNWAIASCCIIKYLIAEQSWEGELCRQRGDFAPCEVPCCAQHPAWPATGHSKIVGSSFSSLVLLCHISCSPLQEHKKSVGGWVSSPWGAATQHRLSCEPCEGAALCQGGASSAEGSQGTRHPHVCRDPGEAGRSGHARGPMPGGLCRMEHAPHRVPGMGSAWDWHTQASPPSFSMDQG